MAASHFLAPGGSFPVRVRDRGLGYRAGVGYGQAERVFAYLRPCLSDRVYLSTTCSRVTRASETSMSDLSAGTT